MSKTLQKLERTLSQPKTAEEAIELDSRLVRLELTSKQHLQIIDNPEMNTVTLGSLPLDEEILAQIRGYKYREGKPPSVILYEDPDGSRIPLRAVSTLFHAMPLKTLWETITDKLGQPVAQVATRQAIVCVFPAVETGGRDYEISPVVALPYNLAEKSLELGFLVGILLCSNQLYDFGGTGTRFVHNKFMVEAQEFTIEKAVENLLASLETLEETIEKAKQTPLPEFAAPVLYWKGTKGQTRVLQKVFAEHDKTVRSKGGADKLTLWDGLMGLTYVSTHETKNVNSGIDLSVQAGSLLKEIGQLNSYDYVKSLGYYLQKQKTTQADSLFQRINLLPLLKFVRDDVLPRQIANRDIEIMNENLEKLEEEE